MTDIKFTDSAISMEGAVGVNEPNPQRPLHVSGNEVHSGGGGGGFSFSNRESAFVNMPPAGERWVWYASGGTARLWSGNDKFSVSPNGDVSAFVTSNIRPMSIMGVNFLGRKASVRMLAQDLMLTFMKQDPTTKHFSAVHPDDKNPSSNFALSHMEGDTLVMNRGGGYVGGVVIEGEVHVPNRLVVENRDVGKELAMLRAEIDELKAKVK